MNKERKETIEWEQVKGFSKYLISTDGQVYSIERDKILSQYDNGCGYMQIVLRNDDGIPKSMRVHRLVYMAHKGKIPRGLEINHIDECKTNNCIDNLELVTHAQNNSYGTHNERISKSLIGVGAKPIYQYSLNGKLIHTYKSIAEANANGFSGSSICNCCKGKLKTHKGYIWKYA